VTYLGGAANPGTTSKLGGAPAPEIRIPESSDWSEGREIFRAGGAGEWDLGLAGGFAATAVKRDGFYHLYYQGHKGYDHVEKTVTHRAVGLATSSDGVRFEKHVSNPVLTWLPIEGIEEGAASAGAFLTAGGDVAMYYGANSAISASEVSADGRYATSSDGFSFTDAGVAIDKADSAVWGSGDELFPIIGFQAGSCWYAYYIPNGTPERAQLGVAWGNAPTGLATSSPARVGRSTVPTWGPGGWARLAPDRYALFLSNNPDAHSASRHIDVYVVHPSSPADLTGPVRTYAFPDLSKGTVLLDEESETWFLFYRDTDASAYRVRTARAEMQGAQVE
jgi:hypothetical protein